MLRLLALGLSACLLPGCGKDSGPDGGGKKDDAQGRHAAPPTISPVEFRARAGDYRGKTVRVRGHVGDLVKGYGAVVYVYLHADKPRPGARDWVVCHFPPDKASDVAMLSGEVVVEGVGSGEDALRSCRVVSP